MDAYKLQVSQVELHVDPASGSFRGNSNVMRDSKLVVLEFCMLVSVSQSCLQLSQICFAHDFRIFFRYSFREVCFLFQGGQHGSTQRLSGRLNTLHPLTKPQAREALQKLGPSPEFGGRKAPRLDRRDVDHIDME